MRISTFVDLSGSRRYQGFMQPRRITIWSIKLLRENGWTQARGGKHQVKMTKPGCRPITLPQHKGRDYQAGLASAILKQAGLQ